MLVRPIRSSIVSKLEKSCLILNPQTMMLAVGDLHWLGWVVSARG